MKIMYDYISSNGFNLLIAKCKILLFLIVISYFKIYFNRFFLLKLILNLVVEKFKEKKLEGKKY